MADSAVTWKRVKEVVEGRGGEPVQVPYPSKHREWRVPSPAGGTFLVLVTLKTRWCGVVIDRWRTTDRHREEADPWLREHVEPYVMEGLRHSGKWGFTPVGANCWAGAKPIQRDALLDILGPWIDKELEWGVPR